MTLRMERGLDEVANRTAAQALWAFTLYSCSGQQDVDGGKKSGHDVRGNDERRPAPTSRVAPSQPSRMTMATK
jgi:hypothetical protein